MQISLMNSADYMKTNGCNLSFSVDILNVNSFDLTIMTWLDKEHQVHGFVFYSLKICSLASSLLRVDPMDGDHT